MVGGTFMNVQVIDPIEYGRVGERPLLATFYRPERTKGKTVPVIVWIHGGAWWAGDRHGDADACQHIARHGLACLSIDYRLSQEAIFPAAIEDCKCAVRYLRAHAADLDILPGKIGAWGPSAGGHLAALLGTSS
ncbi:MAG: alpha/beta hydrolase, partial [Anaerolineae bacterium]|nr:alpha/beta hydrolase [Anaerolineae bacterium]